ncbi:hypothetical protein FRC10_000020 [Ceratobasidium sp. 414]|nr:hypothetical protein FRC10_000020 [Ceratobasidium sp. 414]
MPKHYCDYCDVFLTHDSTSVRKAHNSGRNHLSNVHDYYASLGHDKAQNIIDQITSAYESGGGPPRGGFNFGPNAFGPPPPSFGGPGFGPPMGFGGPPPGPFPPFPPAGFSGPSGPGGMQAAHPGMGLPPPLGMRGPPMGAPPFPPNGAPPFPPNGAPPFPPNGAPPFPPNGAPPFPPNGAPPFPPNGPPGGGPPPAGGVHPG